jgi:BNR repeat-like domain
MKAENGVGTRLAALIGEEKKEISNVKHFPASRIVAGLVFVAIILTLAVLSSSQRDAAAAGSSTPDPDKNNLQPPFATPTPLPTSVIAVGGPTDDYIPSFVRRADGSFLLAFFRFDAQNIYVTSSMDGLTWSAPTLAAANGVVPALAQLHDGSYQLFFQRATNDIDQIYRTSSSDGVTWTALVQVQLGWGGTSVGAPNVIVEADGSLTMVYQISGSNDYITHSTDGGATWDQNHTLCRAAVISPASPNPMMAYTTSPTKLAPAPTTTCTSARRSTA